MQFLEQLRPMNRRRSGPIFTTVSRKGGLVSVIVSRGVKGIGNLLTIVKSEVITQSQHRSKQFSTSSMTL